MIKILAILIIRIILVQTIILNVNISNPTNIIDNPETLPQQLQPLNR